MPSKLKDLVGPSQVLQGLGKLCLPFSATTLRTRSKANAKTRNFILQLAVLQKFWNAWKNWGEVKSSFGRVEDFWRFSEETGSKIGSDQLDQSESSTMIIYQSDSLNEYWKLSSQIYWIFNNEITHGFLIMKFNRNQKLWNRNNFLSS